jgi:hypothetical protein
MLRVTRKAACSCPILCGLSPPVSLQLKMANGYTFGHCLLTEAPCWSTHHLCSELGILWRGKHVPKRGEQYVEHTEENCSIRGRIHSGCVQHFCFQPDNSNHPVGENRQSGVRQRCGVGAHLLVHRPTDHSTRALVSSAHTNTAVRLDRRR